MSMEVLRFQTNRTEIIPESREYQEQLMEEEEEEEVDQSERRPMMNLVEEKTLIGSSEKIDGDVVVAEHDGLHVGNVYLDKDKGKEPESDNKNVTNRNLVGESSEVIQELDPEIIDKYDVEDVLAKQETHDLFCPKCKSNITKRVILKKRKRTPGDSSNQPQRPRLDLPGHDTAETSSLDAVEPDGEPKVFRCLSCFTFFGRGFRPFSCFGNGGEEEEQSHGKTAWWHSCFGKETEVPGDARPGHSEPRGPDRPEPQSENIPPSTIVGDIGAEQETVTEQITDTKPSASIRHMLKDIIPGLFGPTEPAGDARPTGSKPRGKDRPDSESDNIPPSTMVGNIVQEQETVTEQMTDTKPSASTSHKLKPKIPGIFGQREPGLSGVETESKPTVSTGNNLTPAKPGDSSLGQPATSSGTLGDVESGTGPTGIDNQHEEGFGVEILKSIVYGGLVECVTSLGVVSSAAGSGATTVNILALGFANLFSGLTVIAHSLQEVRKEDQETRYQELLGRKQNFRLHYLLSILSFLVFGLIPPLVYAFTFRETDDKDYKLLSAFAASLFCILLLAVGRVRVQTEPKSYFKTVFYYAAVAVSSSGIAFAVGDMIGEFLKQMGWFEPNRAGMFSVLQGHPVEYSGLVSF